MDLGQYLRDYAVGKVPLEAALLQFSALWQKHNDSLLKTLDPLMQDSDLAFGIGGLCYRIEPSVRVAAWLRKHIKAYGQIMSACKAEPQTESYYDAAVTKSELTYAYQRHAKGAQAMA